jgi:hypothetical protein
MEFENNWVVPVLHDGPHKSCMLDPKLKLQMRVTQPRQEPQEQRYSLKLFYDPHMNADNLVAEMTPQEIADEYFRVVPDCPMKLVESPETRAVAELGFNVASTDTLKRHGELVLQFVNLGDDNSTKAVLLQREGVPLVSKRPYDMILHACRSYVNFAFWDDLAQKKNKYRPPDNLISRVTLLVSAAIAEQLSRETGQRLPAPQDGFVTIASREVRP